MKLSRLLHKVRFQSFSPAAPGEGAPCPDGGGGFGELPLDPDVSGLSYRAQTVRPGGVFFALGGQHADGHDYIPTALERGAVAVITQRPVAAEGLIIRVDDSRAAMAVMAAQFYGHPSQHLCLVGITGTNGKTTTSYLVERILMAAGHRVGVVGTINYRYAGRTFDTPVTTPESLDLQRILADMLTAGVTHAVMEVSSHGLDLHRVDQCWLDVGVFTNLTQDHLDYHGDMNAYWASKKTMFSRHLRTGPKQGGQTAVVNADDARGRELVQAAFQRTLTVGRASDCHVRPHGIQLDATGIRGGLETPAGRIEFRSTLVGDHNLENILAAVGAGLALGLDPQAIAAGLAALAVVPGRLEPIANDSGRWVLVDYAHTPDALQHALAAVRDLSSGRLVCVFGCGGDRDRAKRPQMGAIAARLADLSVVTSDNPRTENPLDIIAQILDGIRRPDLREYSDADGIQDFEQRGFLVEADRRRAIRAAIRVARPGDTVLIAGKGHETYQILGRKRLDFDDRSEARRALAPERAVRVPSLGVARPGAGEPDEDSWSVARVLEATGGSLICGQGGQVLDAIGIDSRTIGRGQLFVAIRGTTHDGHDFAAAAIRKGIGAVLLQRDQIDRLPMDTWRRQGATVIAVADTTIALGDLAAYHRGRNCAKVVAITGSNGKTSTRRMTAAVFGRQGAVLEPRGNYNNHIGLPLTLLALEPAHRWAVLELGMNRAGEIDRLAQICQPDLGIITNIGPAHLEGVGSLEGVMQAKAELLQRLPRGACAVLNADDARVRKMAAGTRADVVFYGLHPDAAVRAENIRAVGRQTIFDLILPGGRTRIELDTPGRFMVSNALAAAAAGHLGGLGADEIRAALGTFRPPPGRMTVLRLDKGITVIDDSYNANPASMGAALTTLAGLKSGARAILVAGDMLELGPAADRLHRDLGAQAVRTGVDEIFVTGQHALAVASGARSQNLAADRIHCGPREAVGAALIQRLQPGDWVLVKGSRGMGMEAIVRELKAWDCR